MSTKKVPLVHYVDGERRVIGEAVVETDGSYIDITAAVTVTDPEYQSLIQGPLSELSLGPYLERFADVEPQIPEEKASSKRRTRRGRRADRKEQRGSG